MAERLDVDEVVWTTSSGAPPWLRQTGLALDLDGFVRVDAELRSLSHPNVFAAGDVAALGDPRPKAGVFAVRAGPVLAENIRRALSGKALTAFRPQRSWLVLISLADGRAIADKWGLSVSGRWVNAWKRSIDARFIRRFQR
ncbi:FAD-dependent oxidoreductase (plasmid) [Rhizobium sp. 32-5/1]|uniref:FAD-dependent oxidoreductase n=1 Tax=Rhizobium sp. 32-5/1 TaxID=3019602 RepID=UPI00240D5C19|nr:FAD-dependent oxidoreductase [Rhizobium sp. 32-5/1]WEZ85914.1 FAD-dependent oxidoreductase [Rhizobium sp. 32-5/1]